MKYIDYKSSLIEYMHYYFAKIKFCFVYESSSWSLASTVTNAPYLLWNSVSHTQWKFMSWAAADPRERKLRTRLFWSFEACCQRFFDFAFCVPPAHKLLTSSATRQSKHLGVSSISLLANSLFALASSYHHLSFFCPKISSIFADCLRDNCSGRLHYSLWLFRVLSVHYYHKRIFHPRANLV